MTISFEDLKVELDSIHRDRDAKAEINIKNEGENEDTFLASWKYPIKNGMLITENYIEVIYRFKLDIDHLKIGWKKLYNSPMPDSPYLLRILEYTFFEIKPYLRDFNGESDNYRSIADILYNARGLGLKEYGI